jgi:hypothetical protein
VQDWAGNGALEGRREELLREAEHERLVRELRAARAEKGRVEKDEEIRVRWGLVEDEPKIADLLELNGMPRWAAFEERYVVAEKEGEILAALRYRTEPKRLLLGLLVADPWAGERPLAVALYAGAVGLARELGVGEVIARPCLRAGYPGEAGYHRRGRREWRLDVARSVEAHEKPAARGWRRIIELFGVTAVPFFGVSSGRK